MIDHIHTRLKDWGYFMRRVSTAPIGWPENTIEKTLIEMGGLLISGQGASTPPPLPEHILETERAICRLPLDMKRVVIVHYMTNARTRDKKEMIGLNGMRQYHYLLDGAHAWLDGYFDTLPRRSLHYA